jgi:hypothetical protein
MVGEVVVGQHHGGRFVGHLGAGEAHRDTDVGLAQGGCVVDAVPGHRDHVAAGLQRAHDPDLVLGGDPGDHADVVEPAGQLGVVGHRVQLGSGHRLAGDAQVGGDGAGGHRVVAGDHPYPDARVAALGDGHAGLGAGWVDDADQRDQHDPVEQVLRVVDAVQVGEGEVLRADGEHPHALAGQRGVVSRVALRGVVVERQDVGAAEVAVGPGGEHVGRP